MIFRLSQTAPGGFGQNIQHGQYTNILEVSSYFLIYLANVKVLAQTGYY